MPPASTALGLVVLVVAAMLLYNTCSPEWVFLWNGFPSLPSLPGRQGFLEGRPVDSILVVEPDGGAGIRKEKLEHLVCLGCLPRSLFVEVGMLFELAILGKVLVTPTTMAQR